MNDMLRRCLCVVCAASLGCGGEPTTANFDAREFQQKMKELDREVLRQEKKNRPTGPK